MGPASGNDGVKEVKLLGRIISLTKQGYTREGDPKHAAAIVQRAGVDKGNGVGTPGVSPSNQEVGEFDGDEEILTDERRMDRERHFEATQCLLPTCPWIDLKRYSKSKR